MEPRAHHVLIGLFTVITLGHLETLSGALVEQRDAVGEAITVIGRASEQATATLQRCERLGERADRLAIEVVDWALSRLPP
ncbi:hypothetical protein FEI13_06760 [Halomonas urmiana]|uniref:Uncharacterized protein n=1 Tax=Halomonas urmiana TaxID=490901 RepID=A0A5R8MIY9_9GAMM|nr:hypothetical protein [Halomonas urmiana]TLF51926.1 hypothetical protein FEI13_06760 [Halomonas urmiana]